MPFTAPRSLFLVLLASTSASLACKARTGTGAAEGPIVAKVGTEPITAAEFKQKASIQSPMVRASLTTLEKKKEFLDRIIRLRLIMQESVRQGMDKDDEVKEAKEQGMSAAGLHQKMANEMVHHKFDEHQELKEVPEAESRAFYDGHLDQYVKPERYRLEIILFNGKEGDRKIRTEADRILADLREKAKQGNGGAFATTARVRSDDEATKPRGGDTGFKSEADLTQAYGAAVAQATKGLKANGYMSDLVRGKTGWFLLKLKARQSAVNESFDQARSMIEARLRNDKRSAMIDAWVADLRAKAPVVVYDDALDKVDLNEPATPPVN